MNKLTQTLNNTAGRFTTLVVNNGMLNTSYCAQISSVSDKLVTFYDVNTERNRRAKLSQIVLARSGNAVYRRGNR
jgi:hypothetical protein